MSSSTSRLQLTKLADSENFSNTVLNANWDKVDNGYGTLNSQFTKTSTIISEQSGIAYCVAYKKAGWVTVIGHSAGQRQLTGSGSFQDFETLPEGYRPAEVQYGVGATASGVGIAFEIGTNGLIKYLTPSNTTYWYYSFSFPVG